jgi:DNA-binding transcriptional ArsR family regulator
LDRFQIERQLRTSGLPAPARAIVRVLCERIDRDTNQIPAEWSPSYATLAADTGLSRRTIMRHVKLLAALGWIHAERGSRRHHAITHESVRYQVTVPASDSLSPALVPERHKASDRGAPGLVTGRARASDTAAHSHQSSAHPSSARDDDLLRDIVKDELLSLTGRRVGDGQAAEVVRLVLDGRDVRRPGPYLRRAIRSDPGRYSPGSSASPPSWAEVQAEQERLHQRDRDT